MDEAELAGILERAAVRRTAVGKLTSSYPLDLDGAYRVQRAGIARRVARGERIVGVKMGFTSRAKMAQMGIDEVIWGILTDAMAAGPGSCDVSGLIQPKVEPELVFRLGRRVTSAIDAESAVDAVGVGYEILDSRFEGYKFTLPDVVADNASAAGFGVGPWHAPDQVDIADLPVTLSLNGQAVRSAATSAILGDPWESLRRAARLATAAGITLEPGWIVLAGGITEAVPVSPGSAVTITAAGLGTVGFRAR